MGSSWLRNEWPTKLQPGHYEVDNNGTLHLVRAPKEMRLYRGMIINSDAPAQFQWNSVSQDAWDGLMTSRDVHMAMMYAAHGDASVEEENRTYVFTAHPETVVERAVPVEFGEDRQYGMEEYQQYIDQGNHAERLSPDIIIGWGGTDGDEVRVKNPGILTNIATYILDWDELTITSLALLTTDPHADEYSYVSEAIQIHKRLHSGYDWYGLPLQSIEDDIISGDYPMPYTLDKAESFLRAYRGYQNRAKYLIHGGVADRMEQIHLPMLRKQGVL